MARINFQNTRFYRSSSGKEFPMMPVPHFALVGRSNVGKSSLINYVFQNGSLAKVSATPGKTRLINFFLIDEKAFLVDLPGYGYAKRAKEEQEDWGAMLEYYFLSFPDITFLHLLDSRHPPTEDDLLFIEWARAHDKKVLYIFTKIDKIKKGARKSQIDKLVSSIGPGEVLPFSIREGDGRHFLLKWINQQIDSCRAPALVGGEI